MSIIYAVVGFLMLIAGRQFYSFFVGGMSLVQSDTNAMWISLVVGLIFGVLTFELRRWAAIAATFIAGGFLLFTLLQVFNVEHNLPWFFFLLAGCICAILALIVFDLALVVISVLTGSTMIVQVVSFGGLDILTMFFVLGIFGLVTQFVLLRYSGSTPD